MESTTMNIGAAATAGAYPRVWNRAMQPVIRRLASVVPTIQGTTLSAAGFGQVGDAGTTALAMTPKCTTLFIDVTSFRTSGPPV